MQSTPSHKVTPFIMIEGGKAEEAAQFYVSIFPKATSHITHVSRGMFLSHFPLLSQFLFDGKHNYNHRE
jgi:hypothetical protein